MAARANWKGYLKLSLVSCAVALFPATSSSARVSFNTLNRKTGNRVKRVYVDPQTEETVEPEDQVKGYEIGKNRFVVVEDEDIDAIRIESSHTIDIERFVPRADVDSRYLDAPYYIAPDDRVANEAFAVIRDAMRDTARAGVARVVIARRERMILIEPLGRGLIGTVLRYPNEVRSEDATFDAIPDIEIPDEMRQLAGHIIDTKTGPFEPDAFEDRYETALVAMLRARQAGTDVGAVPAEPRESNVVNLMDALRRSVDADRAAKSAGDAGSRSTGGKTGVDAAKRPAPTREASAKRRAPPAKTAGDSGGTGRARKSG
jgi:DNA end-binding protein Ku